MKTNLNWLFGAAVVLAGMVIWAAFFRSDHPGSGDKIKITVASASTKKEWIDASVKAFNSASKSDAALQLNGKRISVEVVMEELEPGKLDHYRSGTMVADTLSGKIKPTVVSPGEQTWIDKLNSDWRATHGKVLTTGKARPLLRSPVVVALWQSRAMALGCWPTPAPDCTWQELSELAASPNGWGRFGHPEWGKFKLGYGYVGESNSGTFTAVLLCMAGLGKQGNLTFEDVSPTNGCGRTIASVEAAKVHSGKKSSWLLGLMEKGGPDYLDAVVTNEPDVIKFNRDHAGTLREPLVSAYPQDGTVISEHPFAVLDGADWVTNEQAEAARVFLGFLVSDERQRALVEFGLRPIEPAAQLGSPVEPKYGANPEAPLVAVTLPDVLVFDRVAEVWHKVKKHAVIALVFDKSGSMEGEKLTTALKGAQAFVAGMDPDDYLLWMPFDNEVYAGPEGLSAAVGERLIGDIGSTSAGGGTALYDAVARAYAVLQAKRQIQGESRRYGIVVLSDGKDTSSRTGFTGLLGLLQPAEGDPTAIQIHTIGIGNDADKDTLQRIAASAHGAYWDAKTPSRVVNLYKEIAVYY